MTYESRVLITIRPNFSCVTFGGIRIILSCLCMLYLKGSRRLDVLKVFYGRYNSIDLILYKHNLVYPLFTAHVLW